MTGPGTWAHLTGTADDGLILNRACALLGVVVGSEGAGVTLSIHDAAAEADISAANLVSVLKLDTRIAPLFGADGARLGRGLVAILSGTADVTLIYR